MPAILIDTGAAAHMCGISQDLIRTWAARGHIKPAGTRGRSTLYELDSVLTYARARGHVEALAAAAPGVECCIDYGQGRSCRRPAESGSPVPLCARHLSASYLYVADRFRERAEAAAERGTPALRGATVVYFARFGDLIKIGYTSSMPARMAAISPDEVLLTLPGGRPEERALHEIFKRHRVRGEWFRSCPDILDFINEQKTGDTASVAV